MKLEHFKINNIEEVKLFSTRLDLYQKSKIGNSLPFIDLISAFEKLQGYSDGGRLFTALLDLKINFVMLNIDSTKAGGTWNHYFSPGKLEGGTVLDNQSKFNGKSDMHYYYSNFIPRYRSIWDKIMGILILMFKPEEYDKFRKAKSRKKEFERIGATIPQVTEDFIKIVIKGISDFDQKFRTPEVHGTGTIRKWSFTMFSLHETPLIEFGMYWNWLLPILSEIDRILSTIKENPDKN